jgi:hypothetical protein
MNGTLTAHRRAHAGGGGGGAAQYSLMLRPGDVLPCTHWRKGLSPRSIPYMPGCVHLGVGAKYPELKEWGDAARDK